MKALIESNPAVMMGKPVVRGTRITVERILDKWLPAIRSSRCWRRIRV